MAARRNLFSVSGIDISNELNVLEEVSDVSLSDNEERDPSYVPRAASTQESLKITFKQVEDSTVRLHSRLVTLDNFADEEICSTRQGSSTDNEGLTNNRRVVNKVSPKKGRRRQKGLSRQERSKKAKNEEAQDHKNLLENLGLTSDQDNNTTNDVDPNDASDQDDDTVNDVDNDNI
ncbi:hypothetical protein J6590_100381 [Homalodisca vitripennis]|nr:hypothetical protein J6590_100381 [Homalodisca vitripennis]